MKKTVRLTYIHSHPRLVRSPKSVQFKLLNNREGFSDKFKIQFYLLNTITIAFTTSNFATLPLLQITTEEFV